jgi:hypothetical protein
MIVCNPSWLPISGLAEFALCWGGAGFEPRTTDLQSGVLALSHLSSIKLPLLHVYFSFKRVQKEFFNIKPGEPGKISKISSGSCPGLDLPYKNTKYLV